MAEHESAGRELLKGAGLLAGHVVAIVVGVIFMIFGIGLGVGLVTLPLAIPVGLGGLFLVLWGLFGRSEQVKPAAKPSGPSAPRIG